MQRRKMLFDIKAGAKLNKQSRSKPAISSDQKKLLNTRLQSAIDVF
jgi:hypothetical protein